MASTFEVLKKDGAGRLGRYRTAHGTVTTPTLLPVINPNRVTIPPKEMRRLFGTEMVITNSYIIKRTPELRERALAEGVHALIDWDGPVMTDSGTFQMYVYGSVEVEPQEIVAFERDIGVDVGTILDIFSTPDRTHAQAREDMEETLRRARDAADIKGDMALAATVQGSVYPDLRQRCAQAYRDMDVDFHPIGGVVPLMEGQRYRDLVEVIVGAKRGLDPSRPVHLFGAGHPAVFPLAALLGCDLFDSASYAKYAKDGRMITPGGTLMLQDVTELWCPCPVCSTRSADELRRAPAADRERLLAEHNLHVTFSELRRVREAIRVGRLWELAEERARAHPKLLDGLRAAVRHADWLETLEPLSKPSAFFHLGAESTGRPEVARIRRRLLTRFTPRGDLLVVPPVARPYSRSLDPHLERFGRLAVEPAVQSAFGPVPLVLDQAWPFAQSVEPWDMDRETADAARDLEEAFAKAHGVAVRHVEAPLALPEDLPTAPDRDWDRDRLHALAEWQFGKGAGDALLGGDLKVRKSPKTGRIRNVHVDGDHVLSVRASDGYYTLKLAGARRLHATLPAPRLRLVVDRDSAPFQRDGKNAFAKFVVGVDDELRAGDECLVVDPDDDLVAVAQLVLAPSEVPWFTSGPAADVREGVGASPTS